MPGLTADLESSPPEIDLVPLPPFKPDLYERAWASIPHPTLPLLATCYAKSVTVFSLSTLSAHSSLTGGHQRSVRSAAWRPALPPHKLCLVTGSFDSTAGLWRWDGDVPFASASAQTSSSGPAGLEVEITSAARQQRSADAATADDHSERDDDWEFTLVLEGHESEIKSVAFSPSGQYLATCSRDKSVWIWEDVGASEEDDEWETVAVLNEHDGDVKCVAWCPDVPGRSGRGRYSADVLASASYDNTVRIWREDGDGEWVCVAVLEGHEGTVWGLQWESDQKNERFPRLMTFSADRTIRLWSLKEEEDDDEGAGAGNSLFRSGFGGIPNTMRRSIREDWECTDVLPTAHTRDIYSANWSTVSGMIASTGSDGVIAVYREDSGQPDAAVVDEDVQMSEASGADASMSVSVDAPRPTKWRLLKTLKNGHGPYEINHVTWCRRFDPAATRRGVEEMLVTTGDDGIVRPWEVKLGTS